MQFGRPIGGFQLVQEKLANMLTQITQAQLMLTQITQTQLLCSSGA